MGEPCTHPSSRMAWTLDINERGWVCDCGHKPGEEPGYSPEHDRDLLWMKVNSVLSHLHYADLVWVSNGEHGEILVNEAVRRCRDERALDQMSIMRILLELLGAGKDGSHALFYRERHEGILAGKDPRDRCWCGVLAKGAHINKGKVEHFCDEHMGGAFDGPIRGHDDHRLEKVRQP